MNFFIENLWRNPAFFWSTAVIVIFSICCHEFAHARAALYFGDRTAADNGHLTLNPLRQMGMWSLIMFAMVGIAWGQVPVDHRQMRHRYGPAAVAFAGPLTNLLLAIVFCVLTALGLQYAGSNHFGVNMLFSGALINLLLFMLNMLPVPGFDGWVILVTFFPRILFHNSEIVKGSFLVILMLVFVFIEQLYIASAYLNSQLIKLLQTVI